MMDNNNTHSSESILLRHPTFTPADNQQGSFLTSLFSFVKADKKP